MSKLDRGFDPHAPFEKDGRFYDSFVSYLKGERGATIVEQVAEALGRSAWKELEHGIYQSFRIDRR